MKRFFSVFLLLSAAVAFADIIVKPDGTVTCNGRCDGVITQGPGGSYTVCQGNTCVTISSGGGSAPRPAETKEKRT